MLEVSPSPRPLVRKRTSMGTRTENDSSSDLMSEFKMFLLQGQSRRNEEHRIRQMEREQEKERRCGTVARGLVDWLFL